MLVQNHLLGEKEMKKGINIRGQIIHISTTYEGKRLRFSTKRKATKENREYVLKHYERLILEHLNPPPKKEIKHNTLEHYLQRVFAYSKTLRVSTQKNYKSYYEVIYSFFGEIEVRRVSRALIEKFFLYLHSRYTRKASARCCARFVKKALDLAIFDDEITKNPVFEYKFQNLKGLNKPKPLNLFEVQMLLKETKKEIYPSYFNNLLKVAFFTGMRTGEIFALKAKCIDWERNKIKVLKSMNQQGCEQEPKTRSSVREIDILPPVKEALKEQSAKGGKYLFMQENKPFRTTQAFNKAWRLALKNCGLEYRVFYNTRHSFASIMLCEGEEQLWVSKMLGHENLAITLECYAQFLENPDKERAKFLNNLKF